MAFWNRKKTDSQPGTGEGLDLSRLPRHVGIIMDGNGRWAKKRGLPTVSGIDLLLYQAARAFKMFTGKDVDMPALLSALEGKLD